MERHGTRMIANQAMKLVAISRMKNEIDIVEPFVRHHAQLFHRIIVQDDGSTDGTWEALGRLRDEGLPLTLMREPAIGYEQSRYTTALLHVAVAEFAADWVAPLDADEFVEVSEGTTLQAELAHTGPVLLKMRWSNFAWRQEDDALAESNPVARLSRRLPPREEHAKVLVPATLVDARSTTLAQGNHDLLCDGEPMPSRPLESVTLCHFPIRTLAQYESKIAVGYLQYAVMPHWRRDIGFHYIEAFRLLAAGLGQFPSYATAQSRRYSAAASVVLADEPQEAPLRYLGGPLGIAAPRETPFVSVLHCAEKMADRLAELSRLREAVEEGSLAQRRGSRTSPSCRAFLLWRSSLVRLRR